VFRRVRNLTKTSQGGFRWIATFIEMVTWNGCAGQRQSFTKTSRGFQNIRRAKTRAGRTLL
jgi:hypothetical protein